MKLLVTGGAGFIGSAVVRHVIAHTTDSIVNLDKLTYAATLDSVADVADSGRYAFEQVDVCDAAAVARVLAQHEPDAIVHLAAETHVDRSIDAPAEFVRTNVVGTCTLLAAAEAYWRSLPPPGRDDFRFHHVSTDEVFGDLAGDAPPAGEESAYRPSSPYAASKAGADHLARAWHRTYGLPVVLSNSSNNYGPFQFPEKLIPLMVLAAIDGRPLPVYGDGTQVRDWLHVEDHARALHVILTRGVPGESYNVGGGNQIRNIDTVLAICDLLDELAPARPAGVRSYRDLVTRVTDRPGHDRRYALDSSKVRRELGWEPRESFESGLRSTVRWYIDNAPWCRRVQGRLRAGERPGLPRTEVACP